MEPFLSMPASTGDTVVAPARLNMLRRFCRCAICAAACTTTSGLSSPAVNRIAWCAGVHFLRGECEAPIRVRCTTLIHQPRSI
jgi:hypothetical protein